MLEAPPNGGLYVIWFSDTHYYGGRTYSYKKRWYRHLYDLRMGRHKNKYMQSVFDKFGQRFEPEIVFDIGTESEQIEAEQRWLNIHHGKPGCLNLSKSADSGVMRGRKHSPETCQKLRDALTLQRIESLIAFNRDRVWTEEMRKRHSEVHMGFKRSAESVQKQVETWKQNPENLEKARLSADLNRVKKGSKKSESAIEKIKAAGLKRRGIPQSPETVARRVAVITGRKNSPETIALMSESAKIRAREHPTIHGEETRALISSQQAGRIWITNGIKNQRLFPEDAEMYLAQGWERGKMPHRPRHDNKPIR